MTYARWRKARTLLAAGMRAFFVGRDEMATQDELFGQIRNELEETPTPGSPFVTAGRLVETGRRLLSEYGCDHRDVIVAAVMQGYDTYVRPFDLPGVPNLIVEPAVDRALGNVLETALIALFDHICKE